MKKKTYMINHIPMKQVCLKENIILIKCTNMGGLKNVKEPNERKRFSIKGPKFKNWALQKMKVLNKPS